MRVVGVVWPNMNAKDIFQMGKMLSNEVFLRKFNPYLHNLRMFDGNNEKLPMVMPTVGHKLDTSTSCFPALRTHLPLEIEGREVAWV